jgi:vacuolar protein sorting-associated protein 13A/C
LVGKLVLKIPWNNLYDAPVEASLEGLFLLVVPNQEVKYDPAKEEKWSQEAKKAKLQRVEDKKKQEREKGEMGIILLLLLRDGCINTSSMLVIH